jgi:hypothetical protein
VVASAELGRDLSLAKLRSPSTVGASAA